MPAGKHPMAFLGKKSWHTKNLRNVEKVWIAEEKEKNEEKRLAELQKQIEEERQMLELKQLRQGIQGGAGQLAEKLDWMYEGPQVEASDGTAETAAAEEYLLGKEFKPAAHNPVAEAQQLSEQPGALLAAKPPSANDAFSRMHEDPLFLIRQKQLQAREAVVKNPLKMKRVKEELERQVVAELQAKKEAKKKKKDAKKARKKEKKEHKLWSASSSEDEFEAWDLQGSREVEPRGPATATEGEPLPSVGSAAHAEERCRPCSYFPTKAGCRWGEQCEFCHFPHKRQKLSKKRRATCQKFVESKERQIEADPDSLADLELTLPPSVQNRPELKGRIINRLETFAEAVRQQQGEPVLEFGRQAQHGQNRKHIVAL